MDEMRCCVSLFCSTSRLACKLHLFSAQETDLTDLSGRSPTGSRSACAYLLDMTKDKQRSKRISLKYVHFLENVVNICANYSDPTRNLEKICDVPHSHKINFLLKLSDV